MNQFLIVLKVIVSNWKKAKGQLFLTILGIAIASTLWSSIDIVNNQTIKAQKRSIDLLQTAFKPIIIDRELPYVSNNDYVKLRLNGWLVNPVIRAPLKNTNIIVVGIDLLADGKKILPSGKNLANVNFLEMQANGEALLFGSRKTFEKILNRLPNFTRIELAHLPVDTLFGDITTIQSLLNMEGKFTYFEYINRSLNSLDKLPLKNLMLIDDNSSAEFSFISESFTFNLKAFGFLSFFVGMFIVYTSVGMAYDQRILTIKLLKTIGIERTLINLSLATELLLISLFSGSLGAIGGFLLARELLPDINNTVSNIYNSPVDGKIDLSLSWYIYSILIAGLGTLLACSRALLRLDTLKPLEQADVKKFHSNEKLSIIVSIILLPLTLFFYFLTITFNIKIANFLFLGSVIVVGCTLLPLLIKLLLSFAAKKLPERFALSFWLLRDTQKFGTLLFAGYIAFFLALSINVGVHGMVTSFKSTFVEWLENRIFAEYYINIANQRQLNKIQEVVKKYDGEIYPIIKNEGRFNDKVVEIYGFNPSSVYEENWPLLDKKRNAWNKIRNGEIVFVSEQYSIREKIKLGDLLELEINDKKIRIEVGGIYADYGNPNNQLMMRLELFKTFFSPQIPSTIAVKLSENNRLNFFNELSSKIEINPETIIIPQQVRRISLEIFDNTFKISFQLALITLFVAAFTLYTNLISINKLRKKDLLPVYLIGFSKSQVIRLELLKIFILTNIVCFFSIGMGVVIAFILSEVINPSFFGWRIPIQIFPKYWLQIWIIATTASLFSTILSLKMSNVRTQSNFNSKIFRSS